MKYVILLISLSFCLSLQAQEDKVQWFSDKTEAMNFATTNNAQILLVFAGSDWCIPCIKFKNDILHSSEFEEFADQKMAILYLDFPVKKKNKLSEEQTTHNEGLAEKYNQSGAFPKIVLADKALVKVKDVKYKGQSPDEFIALLK